MINVYSDNILAGALGKQARKAQYVFTYRPDADQTQSVSLTMPVRLKSYVSPIGNLHWF